MNVKNSIGLAFILLCGCRTEPVSQAESCLDLSRLNTREELIADQELCPLIFSAYQDRLFDDYSGNISGEGCFEDIGCPDVQLECPYTRFGGETSCLRENVLECFNFIANAGSLGLGIDEIEDYLRCNCVCS